MQNCSTFLILSLIIALLTIGNGQFFTKTGSKSIPRMGRRADNSLWSLIPRPTPQHKNKIDRNNSEFDNSKSSQSDRNEEPFGSNGPNETDMNTNEQKSRTAPLQVDDDSDDRFDTDIEIRKLEKILSSFIDKTANNL